MRYYIKRSSYSWGYHLIKFAAGYCYPPYKNLFNFYTDQTSELSEATMVALFKSFRVAFNSVQFSSVIQSCPTLWDPMNRSMPGLPVRHQLPLPFPQDALLTYYLSRGKVFQGLYLALTLKVKVLPCENFVHIYVCSFLMYIWKLGKPSLDGSVNPVNSLERWGPWGNKPS